MTTGVLLFTIFVSFISYKRLKDTTIEDDIEKAKDELNKVVEVIENVKNKTPI